MSQGQVMDRQTLGDGTTLFREGQPATTIYLIAQGEVGLYKLVNGKQELKDVCQVGEFVGINATLGDTMYSMTANVKGAATIIPIERAKIVAQLSKMDKLTLNVVHSVVKRLNRVTESNDK